jgi:hypothetical protein
VRFLEWVDKSQRLKPGAKKYYRYGWRLLQFSDLAGMRLNWITQDEAECTIFRRPVVVNRKAKETKMIPCSEHYTNQALLTLKRCRARLWSGSSCELCRRLRWSRPREGIEPSTRKLRSKSTKPMPSLRTIPGPDGCASRRGLACISHRR